jgi:hypothetical protein
VRCSHDGHDDRITERPEDDVRHLEILTALYERHPESREILTELDNLFGA